MWKEIRNIEKIVESLKLKKSKVPFAGVGANGWGIYNPSFPSKKGAMDGAINSVFRQDIMGKSPLVLCSLLSLGGGFKYF